MIDIILAIILDFIIGDPYWFPHPVIYIGKFISLLEKRARGISKSKKALKVYGGFIAIIVGVLSFIIPMTILNFLKPFSIPYHFFNILIIWTTIAARCLHNEAGKVYKELKKNDIKGARIKLSYIVGRDTTDLSEKEIIRADVETVAENTSDGVIAPLLYAIIGGAPLAMLYKSINTMDSMLGYMSEKYRHIGFFPAKVDDLFNLIPARITGILMVMVAPIVGGNCIKTLRIMIRDRRNHKSPNCAYPEGATAGALGVQLGGANIYFGEIVNKPTIGDKEKELSRNHIIESIKLMYSSEILFIVICILILILH